MNTHTQKQQLISIREYEINLFFLIIGSSENYIQIEQPYYINTYIYIYIFVVSLKFQTLSLLFAIQYIVYEFFFSLH